VVINRDVIVKNIVLTDNAKKNVAIGVDNGLVKHYVIGNSEGIFNVGSTTDWKVIEHLRNLYNATMVIDALPYPKKPSELVSKYPNKVFVNYYKRDKDDLKIIRWGKNEKGGVVYSDRNKLFDEIIEQFYSGNIVFNIDHISLQNYIEHWESLYLAKNVDNLGIERTSWESSNGEDHFAHATNYWYIAMDKMKSGGGGVVENIINNRISSYNPVINKNKTVDGQETDIKFVFEKPNKNWDEY
jgi:hypothetical protein